MNKAKRGIWSQLERARMARDGLRGMTGLTATEAGERRYRSWQRVLSAFVAATLFVGPITVTVETGRDAAGVLAAGSHRLDDEAWRTIQDLASLRIRFAMNAAEATPIVDPTAPITFRPQITQSTGSGGGVPVVNIATPNQAGISLNQYQSFNIDAVGLILNNSLQGGTTLTGGNVSANPNLNGRTASVIVNQVTSSGPSYASVLAGPLEVFGAPATVVIANPNGIAVRGAGFTNTVGVTLTTGTPQFLTSVGGTQTDFTNGEALAYDVTGGHIQIEGNAGVNGPGAGIEGTVGTIDLIGETIGINAPLYAGTRINVIAGDQRVTPTVVDATTGSTTYGTSANGSANTAAAIGNVNQGYAIDATAYGAMTAGQIAIVATPAGMGVRSDAALSATAGDLTLSSNGDLTTTGAGLSAGNYEVSAQGDVVSTGTVKSNADLSVVAGHSVTISAQTTAVNNITLSAGQDVALTGSLASGKAFDAAVGGAFNVSGSLLTGTDATITSGTFDVPGVVIVQQNGIVTTQGDITGSGSIAFGQSGTMASGHDVNLSGKLLANDLQVNAANSATFADVQAGGAFGVVANGSAGNGNVTFNGNAASVGDATVRAAGDVVVNGTMAGGAHTAVTAQGNITVASWGTLQSVGDLSMTASTGSVNSTGSITSGGALAAQAAQNVALTGTTNAVGDTSLSAGSDVTIAGTFADKGNGTLTAGHDVTLAGTSGFTKDVTATAGNNISVTGALQGNNVTLTANDAIALNDVQANGALAITTTGTAGSGDIAVNGTVASLSSGALNAAGAVAVNGTLKTAGTLGIAAATDTTIAGTLTSNGDMTLSNTTGSLASTGTIQSGGNLTANAAQSIDLGTGATSTLGDLSLTAGQNVTMNGTIVSQGNGTVTAGGAISGAASLAFGLNASLASVGDTTLTGSLRGATIQTTAGGSGTFANVQAGSNIAMAASSDLSVTGTLVGGANVNMTAGRDVNVSGTTTVTLDTTLQSGRDVNVTGTLNGQGNGYLTAGRDIIGNGSLGFQQSAVLNAAADVAQSGLIQGQSVQASAGGNMALNNVQSATTVTLNAGTSSLGDLTVNGAVSAAQGITATALGNVTIGSNGKLAAGSTIGVAALNDINVAGAIESVGDTALNAQFGSVNATGGINSGAKLSIATWLDLSLGASTTSVGDMTLTAGRNAVLNGTLVSQSNGYVSAGQDITGPGTQAFSAAAVLTAQRDISLIGALQANSVQAAGGDSAALNNVTSATTLSLTANGNAGNGDASIAGTATAPGDVTITAARDAIVNGSLGGGSMVALTATRNLTITGGVQSASDLNITATSGTASLTGTAATSGALNITSGLDTILGGQTNALGAVNVQAGNNVQLTGSLAGQAAGTLTAGQDITGAGSAAFAQAATLAATNNVALTGSLQGASVSVIGLNNAGLGTVQSTTGDLSVKAFGLAGQGDVMIGGAATSMGNLILQAARDLSVTGAANGIGAATIAARRNATTSDVTAGGALSMTAANGSIKTGNLKTNANLSGTAGNSLSTGLINAGGTVTLQAQGLDGTGDLTVGGAMASGGETGITATRDATLSSTVKTGDALTVSAGRNLTVNGDISTNADTTLTATIGNLGVTGAVTTVGNLNASAGGPLALAGGLINGNTTLTSGTAMSLTNAFYGLGVATITAGGAISGGGSLTFGNDIALTSGAGLTLGGVQGAGQLTATSVDDMSFGATTAVGNVTAKSTAGSIAFNGQLQSGGDVQLTATNDASVTGGVSSAGKVTVTGKHGNVNIAGVSSNGDTTLTAGKTLTLSGTSVVAGEFSLTGGNVTLSGSQSGSKSIAVAAQGTLDASQSSIVSSQNLQMSGTNVTLGNAIVGGTLNAQASNQLSLVGSAVDVVGNATLTSQNGLYNASNVLAGGALNVSAPSITNAANASLASTSTTTISATNFTNAGLVNGKTTSVNVGGTLNNSGGSLMGVNALTINAGALNNQNGLIFAGDPNSPTGATGDLSITINGGGSAFANAGGQLLAQRNLTLGAVNAALDPSQGTISQGGQLSITAGSINVGSMWNYGGQSVSVDGINGITNTGTMTGTAPLTISTNGTFTNYGQVIGNDVTFNGSLYNVANAVMHAGSTLSLNGSVTNRGTVESAGDIAFNGGGNYDNQSATTQANGNILIQTGGTVYNQAGMITANGNVTLSAGAVINDATAGAMQTQVQMIAASADEALYNPLIIGTRYGRATRCGGGGDGCGGLVITPRNATFADLGPDWANGVIDVQTNAPGTCDMATDCYPDPTVQVGSKLTPGQYGYETIALPEIERTITSQAAGTAGTIMAGGSVNISTASLSNAAGVVSAGLDVNLNLQSLNNGTLGNVSTQVVDQIDQGQLNTFLAQLNAFGTIGLANVAFSEMESTATINASVAAPSSSGSATSFGQQGTLLAGRDLNVSGGNVVNAGIIYAGRNFNASGTQSFTNQGSQLSSTSTQPGCTPDATTVQCAFYGYGMRSGASTTTFSYQQQNATIVAGNDLVIAAGQVSNTYGTLLAGHDVVIGGVGTTASSTTPAQGLTNTSGTIVAGNNVTLNVSGALTNTLPPPVSVHQNYGTKEEYTGCMTSGGYKQGYCEAYVDQQSGNSSLISAGNNLQINAGSLANIGSLISAGTSAAINVAGPVVNEAQTLNAYWHSHWVQETGMFSKDKPHDIWACGSAAECTALYGSAYTSVGGTIDPPQPVGNIAATIEAPNLSITSGGQIENVGNVLGMSVTLTGQKLINGITTANTYAPRVNAPSQVISLSPVNVKGASLFSSHAGTVSTPVAGQASYVDQSLGSTAMVGPQLLLTSLPSKLQPSSTLFYYNPQEEDLLLQQAALQQTGKASFVDGLSYDSKSNLSVTEQEKAYLYANALSYAEANDLQLGQALTQTQITALDKPMLWYVEQTVPDPSCTATGPATCPTITALMPQVYLPSTTSALSAGGNIIGTDVTLNFEGNGQGSILNTGSITASDTLKVDTPTLTNEANQVNIGQIWSKVKGGYVDTTGTEVQPGGFMSAANMDLNVQTLNQIGGALQKLNADGTIDQAGTQQMLAALQQQLGGNFTQMTLTDQLHTDFVKQGGGLPTFVVAALAIAASIVTAGAAAAAAGVVMTQLSIGSVLIGALGGMVGSAVSQVASGQGFNFGQILEAGAIGAITAGAFAAMGASTQALQQFGSKIANGTVGLADVGNALKVVIERGVVTATAESTIEGTDFGQALEGSAISDLGAIGASAIGTEFNGANGHPDINNPLYVASHAALGCVLSAAQGTGCAGGAIGGAVSAASAETIAYGITGGQGNPNSAQLAAITSLSMLAGGSVAAALGQNADAAASVAENETLNNTCGSDDPNGCGKKLGALGALAGAASAFFASLVGDEVTVGGNLPLTLEEMAAGASLGRKIGTTIGNGADALLSEGNTQTTGTANSTEGGQSTPGQTLANSRAAHNAAVNEVANGFAEQGAVVQPEVTLDAANAAGESVRARADQVVTVTGSSGGTLQVPPGYVATDLNGNVLQSIPLNSAGQVIVEVKTGGGNLTSNQATVYPSASVGNAAGAGRNAANANVQGPISPTPVVIIRPKAL
ncbi:filamentous hemagglutinin N-terminal domain-containing protein [Trinickia sp. EG282A]|uniref:two-partner secretion domain-containing protein n=1 Tax=Trinickia sp. EG282A TaxID=3237013 RepID=UPI0034D17225